MEVSLDARALVVDDSRTVRVRVRMLLEGTEDFNFEVSEAADGSEALKLLEKTAIDRLPDVILLHPQIRPSVVDYSGDLPHRSGRQGRGG